MARKRIPTTESTVSDGAAGTRARQTKTTSGKRSTSEQAASPAINAPEAAQQNPIEQTVVTTADLNALHESIARLAYSYWEARGAQGGSAEEDWLRAEQEIRNGRLKADEA